MSHELTSLNKLLTVFVKEPIVFLRLVTVFSNVVTRAASSSTDELVCVSFISLSTSEPLRPSFMSVSTDESGRSSFILVSLSPSFVSSPS